MKIRMAVSLALTSLMAAFTLTVVSPTPAHAAEYLSSTFTCLSGWSCRVTSDAGAGVVEHWKVQGSTWTRFGRWDNTSRTQRTSWHGSGTQRVYIFTGGTLHGQSHPCICLTSQCVS
jgi:hypothetical protein